MLSFAFRNPDQSVTSYNKAFRGHRNVAKGNQFCEMRGRYIGVRRRNRNSIREVNSSGVRSIGVGGCHSDLTRLADQRQI